MRRPNLLVVLGSALILVAGLVSVRALSHPLRRGPRDIERRLLAETPLGTPFAQVLATAQGAYSAVRVSPDSGFMRRDGETERVVGVKSIRARMGTYRSGVFARTSVSVFWGFDARGHLIETWVWKTVDSL